MIATMTKNPLALAGVAVLAAAIGAGGMWIAERAAPGALSGADQARVELVVRDYVLDHPEIIPEAMDRLKRREAGKLIAANRKAILEPFGDAWPATRMATSRWSNISIIIAASAGRACLRSPS